MPSKATARKSSSIFGVPEVQNSAPPKPGTPATLAIAKIAASPTNPRKRFDNADLLGLADSIRAVGVLERLIVRPLPDGAGGKAAFTHELVAGERRLKAAELAGLKDVPVEIRDLTAREVLEIQVIENDQRADMTDLERSGGYHALIAEGMSIDQIGKRTGKSESTVRSILRLGRLPASLAAAIADERVSRSVAELVCRLPSKPLRELAAEMVLAGERTRVWFESAKKSKNIGRNDPLNFADTKQMIEEEFTVELKGAPFDPKDRELVVAAGACTDCPKLAGNNRADFPEGRADICTDVECFRGKCTASKSIVEADARRRGLTVLPEKARKECIEYGHFRAPSDLVQLDQKCFEANHGRKTWGELLNGVAESIKILTFDKQDRPVLLANRKAAIAALKKSGKIKPQPKTKSYNVGGALVKSSGPQENQVIIRATQLLAKASARAILDGVPDHAFVSLTNEPVASAIRVAAQCAWDDDRFQLDEDARELIEKSRPLEDQSKNKRGAVDQITEWIGTAPVRDLLAFLVELAAHQIDGIFIDGRRPPDGSLAFLFRAIPEIAGVKVAELKKKARQELIAEAAAAAKEGK